MFHGSGGEKTFLQTTCMFHSGGCIFSYVNTFSKGVTVITMSLANPISPHAILKVCHVSRQGSYMTFLHLQACDKYKPVMLMIGSHHTAQMKSVPKKDIETLDLSSVKLIVPMGTATHVSFPSEMRKIFPNSSCNNAYGSSETSGISKGVGSYETMGQLVHGVVAKVVDVETGEELGPNRPGELLVTTGGMMISYINVPKEVAEAAFDEEGFFRTGDLVEYNEQGDLFYK